MNHFITALQEARKNGPSLKTPCYTGNAICMDFDMDFDKMCTEQIELYNIGKGRLQS